jgi:DNA-binding transcriptional MerR regulator
LIGVTVDQNDFLEFLQLEHGEPHLVTKSELLERVRQGGYSISDRQLTFYVSEGLLPKSVRVGSRAGAYPAPVVSLLSWILRAREMGVSVEAIKELIPVWKFLMRARKQGLIDLAELEYIARQQLSTLDAVLAVPELVTYVFAGICRKCHKELRTAVLDKNGSKHLLDDPATTIGFAAIAHRADESGGTKTTWFGYRRIAIATPPDDYTEDPTTVILGSPPNGALPDSPRPSKHHGGHVNGSSSESSDSSAAALEEHDSVG